MSDILQLGGNIELLGASAFDAATLIVLKKIVGNYARQFSNRTPFQKLSIAITKQEKNISLSTVLVMNNNSLTADANHTNLFMGLDIALKQLERELG